MKQDEIIRNIAERLSIGSLNAMQQAVAASRASRLIVLAPTGSGKTVAIAIAMLRAIGEPSGATQAVVLVPSRELALQVGEVIRRVASGMKTVTLFGGHSMTDEVNSLTPAPDVIIATPGRLLDHLQRRTIALPAVTTLVIDEYDKSLEAGFAEEMRRIVRRLPALKTVVLTSATPIADIPDYIDMSQAETIDCTDGRSASKPRLNIARVESPARDKADTLVSLLRSIDDGKALVFVNHRESAERVYDILTRAGLPATLYHGGLEQNDREKAVRLLDNGSRPVMVTTDLGSRGLDLDKVSAVIHYHMPVSAEAWTHRNGRTARAGETGEVYVITSEADTVPEYVTWNHDYVPRGSSTNPIRAHFDTLHFNSGKKEKISRGDIVGFLCQKGGLDASQIGRIDLSDHQALAAVPAGMARQLVDRLRPEKLKGRRVRVSAVE